MSHIEAMKQALEALSDVRIEYDYHGNPLDEDNLKIAPAIKALEEAIAEAEKKEQEFPKRFDTHPQPNQPLTDESKDAQRYRLLRRGQQWSVINGIGDVLRADALDAAIDAAAQHQGEHA